MKKNVWKKYSWLIILLVVILLAEMVLLIVKPWKKPRTAEQNSGISLTDDPVLNHLLQEGARCGYENAFSELALLSSTKSGDLTFHRYQQYYQGLKVENQSVVCVTDPDGNILSVTGNIDDVDPQLSLTPTVEKATVVAFVTTYLEEKVGASVANVDVGELSQDKLCIYGLRDSQDVLAYMLDVSFTISGADCGCWMVVDANTGAVQYMETASASSDGTEYTEATYYVQVSPEEYKEIECSTNEAGEYLLLDTFRKIQVMDADLKVVWYFENCAPGRAEVIDKSSAVIYQLEEGTAPDKSALDAYIHTQKAWNYFTEITDNIKHNTGTYTVIFTGVVNGDKGDNYDTLLNNADAATYESGDARIRVGIASEGRQPLSNYIDLTAHEYAHTVEKRRVGININGEAGAFVEAFADVFGELTEAYNNGTERADWVNTARNIADPSQTNNWRHVDEIGVTFGSKEYKMSTILSHTAYLLQQNGVERDRIAALWFDTMLLMPEDGTFYEVRELMELAASHLKWSEADIAKISAAFDAVGIETDNSANELEVGVGKKIQVNDFAGGLYDNYDYRLWHLDKYEKSKPATLYPTEKKELSKDSVRNQDPVDLGLEKGVYLLELKDCDPVKDEKRYYYLCVTENGGDIRIDTFDGTEGFGSVAFTGTVFGGEDGNKLIANASVNISTQTSYYDKKKGCHVSGGTFTCTTDSSGKYSVSGLPVGSYTVFAISEGQFSEDVVINREDLRRLNVVSLVIEDVNLEKLVPHLQLYYSCERQLYGMDVGAEKYYAIAATSSDCLNLNFNRIVSKSAYTLSGDDRISQKIAVLSEVTNFATKDACTDNLYAHISDSLANNLMSRGNRRMYMYEGKLYYVSFLGYGMGDPPAMLLEAAVFKRVSADTCTVDVPRYMSGTMSGRERFTFTRDGDHWKISRVQSID